MPHTPVLLVIDMQEALLTDAHDRDATVARVAALRDRARNGGVPVIAIQHRAEWLPAGTDGWRLIPEFAREETVVHKTTADSFSGTDLRERLAEHGATEVVVTGYASEYCVDTTARSALGHGYDVVLVADGHTTAERAATDEWISAAQAIAHHNNVIASMGYPGRSKRVMLARDVDFGVE